jgi:carbon storage regulator
MLVLSRNSHEKIVFPTLGVSVEILQVKGNKVRIGIDAPAGIPVHRSEVAERMFREGLRHERPK